MRAAQHRASAGGAGSGAAVAPAPAVAQGAAAFRTLPTLLITTNSGNWPLQAKRGAAGECCNSPSKQLGELYAASGVAVTASIASN